MEINKKAKTICLLEDSQDLIWIRQYWNNNHNLENILIIALSLKGILAAKELELPYKIYSELAWQANYSEISKIALIKTYGWYKLEKTQLKEQIEALQSLARYPLFESYSFDLVKKISSVLYSCRTIKKVLEIENPGKMVVSGRINPLDSDLPCYAALGIDGGLEQEVAGYLCKNHNVEFLKANYSQPSPKARSMGKRLLDFSSKLLNPISLSLAIAGKIKMRYHTYYDSFFKARIPKIIWPNFATGPKVLFFVCGDYYLNDILPVLEKLIEKELRVCLIFFYGSEGSVTSSLMKSLREKGVCVFRKRDFKVQFETKLRKKWFNNAAILEKKLMEKDDYLHDYFSDQGNSFFETILPALKAEIRKIPHLVVELLRTELILKLVDPDLVVAQFSHTEEPRYGACDVLPARLMGIPTLSMDHGVEGCLEAPGYNPSSHYYATCGEFHKLALSKSLEWSIDNLFAIGLSRFDSRVGDSDIRAAKSELGFNPDAPLCVFCSVSEIGGFELIHSTFHVLERILELKRKKPDLQIVYRVHHGINYDILREYFQALNIPGLFFEESLQPPHPLFLDLVKAADFVVAQAGSAISESLVTGVPVIYLCALSIVDPAYLDCEAILVADSFDKLDSSIQQLLDSPLSRQEVRRLAQPFLDKIICGADGATNKRLADLIFQLLDDQDRCNLTGWGDWLKRFEKSFITDAKLD